jgi:hypothetical protein
MYIHVQMYVGPLELQINYLEICDEVYKKFKCLKSDGEV